MKFNIDFLGLRSGHSNSNFGNSDNLLEDIRNSLKNYLGKLEVVDIPFNNRNGLTQYHYTDKQSKVRNTRLMIAKNMGIALTDGTSNKDYLMKLASAAEENGFGQCNEMAALAASKLALISQKYKLNIYTFQMPDTNHAMVLLSRNIYRSSSVINWGSEFNFKSIVADLWQGILAPKQPEFLSSYAKKNLYTKSKPRAFIQTQIW